MNFLKIQPVILILALCAAASSAADNSVTAVSIEGEEEAAVLLDVTPTGFKFQGDTKDAAEVRFNVSAATAETSKPTLYLRNGDVLKATIVSGDDKELKLKSDALGDITLNNNFLDAIVFPLKEAPPNEILEAFLKAPPSKDKDLLLLPKGDKADGSMEKFTAKELNFNTGGQSRAYPFEQIAAFRLAALEELKVPGDLQATVSFADGSRLTAKLTGWKDAALQFVAIDGQTRTAGATTLKSIAFKGGRLFYLSDLNPKTAEDKPLVGGVPLVFHWRKDQAVTGRPLMIAGKVYEKGLGVHSYSRLVFDLGGNYTKFLVLPGMDAGASQSAVCSWKISVDGKEAAAGTGKPNEPPKPQKFDVKGAKELELVCDYGPDEDDAGDHFDWANARLIK